MTATGWRRRCLGAVGCAVLASSLIASGVSAASASFKDMQGHWAEQGVQLLQERGIAGGYPDGTFKPNNTVSKVEFFTMLNKVMGFKNTQAPLFTDVAAKDWYYNEVAKALAAGYISGEYKDGAALNPGAAITRQEAALMIMKAFRANPSKDLAVLKQANFKDANQIDSWRKPAIDYMLSGNIMKGFPDRTFKPKDKVTRAQIAAIMNRVYELKGNAGTNVSAPSASAATIVSVLPLNPISVMQNQKATSLLPKSVTVTYSNGAHGTALVFWDNVDTSELGKHTVKGSIAGTNLKTELLVFVVSATGQTGGSTNPGNTGGGTNTNLPSQPIPTVPTGQAIGNVQVSFSSLMSTIQINVSEAVTSVKANGITMHYEGSNKYSLATAGLKLGDKITIVAYGIRGEELQKYVTTVQQTNN
jgi:hypothetical protein